jgi:hypothetical protein
MHKVTKAGINIYCPVVTKKIATPSKKRAPSDGNVTESLRTIARKHEEER